MGKAAGERSGLRRLRAAASSTAAFLVLAAGAGDAQAAVECGDTITQDRKLKQDLIDCPATGLIIGAPGVTVDLNGHRLDGVGDSNSGILNSGGHDDVVIKGGGGGSVTQFGRGVEMGNTQGSRITGVRFKKTDNQFSSVGIFLHSAGTTDVVVRGNSIAETDENDAIGILLQGTTGVEVVENQVRSLLGQNSVGIQASLGAQDSVIDGNVVNTIKGRAIYVADADQTRVLRNRVIRGRDRGIEIDDGAADTLVKSNVANKNEDGILVLSDAGAGTKIVRNTAKRSEEDGIEVDVDAASIGRNLVLDNADWGIEANAGVTDLGGNRAGGNGEPQQCLNVACSPP